MRKLLLLGLALTLGPNFLAGEKLTRDSPEFRVIEERVEARRLSRELEGLKKENRGRIVFFLVKESGKDYRPPHMEIRARDGNQKFEIPLIDSSEVGKEIEDADIPAGSYSQGALGGLLGHMFRGNRQKTISRHVYLKSLDFPAGKYDWNLIAPDGRHSRTMELPAQEIKAGELVLFTHHWGAHLQLVTRIANSSGFESAVEEYLKGMKELADYWPVMEMSEKTFQINLDLDYRERQHAKRPKVILYSAQLKGKGAEIGGRLLYQGIKPFGGGTDRYTHTYYTLNFPSESLEQGECYDLELTGLSTLDVWETAPFEPDGRILGKNVVCIGHEMEITLKGHRETGSSWVLGDAEENKE